MRITLTLRGIVVLLVGAGSVWGATLIALPDLAYIGCIFLVLLALCVLWQFVGRRFGALTRAVSNELLAVGRESTIQTQLLAQSLLPTPLGRWHDGLPDALTGDASGPFATIDSSLTHGVQTMTVGYSVTGVRRGVHKIGPFRVNITDPFGLTRRQSDIGTTTSVVIAPAIVPLAALPVSAGEAGGSLHSSTSHLGEGSDNLIARPYAPGDSMRRIHWRATAHRDQLMVRQEEQESTPRAIVILDRAVARWPAKAAQFDAKDEAFETALSLCISVATRLMTEGYLVHIVDQDGNELCDPLAEEADLAGMMSLFSTVVAHGSDHLDSLRSLVPDGGAGPLVVLTRSVSVEDAAALAPLAHSSTFAVLFAADSDPLALDDCHNSGWRTCAIASATVANRDDVVGDAWLSVLEQGASRVES